MYNRFNPNFLTTTDPGEPSGSGRITLESRPVRPPLPRSVAAPGRAGADRDPSPPAGAGAGVRRSGQPSSEDTEDMDQADRVARLEVRTAYQRES